MTIPETAYRRDINILTWLLAEVTWEFNHHRHDGSSWGTAWGPVMPHWM